MKKIHVLFVAVALFAAAAGVCAKGVTRDSVIYYEDLPTMQGTCNVEITPPCVEGSEVACKTTAGNNVWKIVDGGACQQVFRDLQ